VHDGSASLVAACGDGKHGNDGERCQMCRPNVPSEGMHVLCLVMPCVDVLSLDPG
jgi:hypothetical protein